MSAAVQTQQTIDAAGLRKRATRMLALVDLARALPGGDTPFPAVGAATDRDEQLSILLQCLQSELEALHLVGSAGADAPMAVHPAQAAEPVAELPPVADTVPPAAGRQADTPVQLLRKLDGWLCNTGHDAAHPWRRSIAATLAAQWAEGPTVSAVSAGHVFYEISELVESLEELMQQCLNGCNELWPAAFSVVNHVGWLADSATAAHGADSGRKTVEQWFLSPRAAGALQDAAHATQWQGGAA